MANYGDKRANDLVWRKATKEATKQRKEGLSDGGVGKATMA